MHLLCNFKPTKTTWADHPSMTISWDGNQTMFEPAKYIGPIIHPDFAVDIYIYKNIFLKKYHRNRNMKYILYDCNTN